MRTELAMIAVALTVALDAGAAQAQRTGQGYIAFEIAGEDVKPADLTRADRAGGALGQAHHWGYHYRVCRNYYRWYWNYYYGWQRYYVGTRCF
jgi:hypothetical protein